MNQPRQPYFKPETLVSQVEVETSICAGSVEMTAKPGVDTEAQIVNTNFGNSNDFTPGNEYNNSTEWDKI